MSPRHPDIGPELRQLAQALLDRLDPALRAAAAMAGGSRDDGGRCQQVWCPVCALAALVTGEQHPLLTVIGEHSAALVTVIRAMVADPQAAPSGPTPPAGAGPQPGAPGTGRYQSIPVVHIPAGGEPAARGADRPGP